MGRRLLVCPFFKNSNYSCVILSKFLKKTLNLQYYLIVLCMLDFEPNDF